MTKVKTYRIELNEDFAPGDTIIFNSDWTFSTVHVGDAVSLNKGTNPWDIVTVQEDWKVSPLNLPAAQWWLDAATYDPDLIQADVFDMDNMKDWTDKVAMTADERANLANQSGTNTGDQAASDFDIKDIADSTDLRAKWSGKQDALTEWNNIHITTEGDVTTISADNTTYTASDFDIKDLADSLDKMQTWDWKWDVHWPSTSTVWNIVTFNAADWKIIQDSWIQIALVSSLPADYASHQNVLYVVS